MTKKSISLYGWNDEISLVHWVNLPMNRDFFLLLRIFHTKRCYVRVKDICVTKIKSDIYVLISIFWLLVKDFFWELFISAFFYKLINCGNLYKSTGFILFMIIFYIENLIQLKIILKIPLISFLSTLPHTLIINNTRRNNFKYINFE